MAAHFARSDFYNSRVRSQSDSDLLGPKPGDPNGLYGNSRSSLRRDHSADDLATETQKKRRGLLARLVRPWKWRKAKERKRRDKAVDPRGERKEVRMLSR